MQYAIGVVDVKVTNLQTFSHTKYSKNFFLSIVDCQLNVEDIGFEPMTPCVQGRCSSQLS